MYTDLLIRIKNAKAAKKSLLKAPYSKMDFSIAEILVNGKFLKSVEKKGRNPKRVLAIALHDRPIDGIRFLSKPSKKFYVSYKELRPVRRGFGMSVISTPKGIMTDKEARKNKVGGELLFEIW